MAYFILKSITVQMCVSCGSVCDRIGFDKKVLCQTEFKQHHLKQ